MSKVIIPVDPKVIIPVHHDLLIKSLDDKPKTFFLASPKDFINEVKQKRNQIKIKMLDYGERYDIPNK